MTDNNLNPKSIFNLFATRRVLRLAGLLILLAGFALNPAHADGLITGGVNIPEGSKLANELGLAAEGATRGISAPGAAIGDAAAVGRGGGGSSSAGDGGSGSGGGSSGGSSGSSGSSSGGNGDGGGGGAD